MSAPAAYVRGGAQTATRARAMTERETMRRQRQPCAVCKKTVVHFDGKPWGTHVRSKLHREAMEAAAPPAARRRGATTKDRRARR
jgi:hypothetical protein